MAQISKHICIGDTRWDTIAHLAYGDFSKIADIASANTNLDIRALIPSGTIVNVPIIEVVESDVIGLPPWKQVSSTEGIETAKAASTILAALQTSSSGSTNSSFDGSFD